MVVMCKCPSPQPLTRKKHCHILKWCAYTTSFSQVFYYFKAITFQSLSDAFRVECLEIQNSLLYPPPRTPVSWSIQQRLRKSRDNGKIVLMGFRDCWAIASLLPNRVSGQKSESDSEPQRTAARTSNRAGLEDYRTKWQDPYGCCHRVFNQLDCNRCSGWQLGSYKYNDQTFTTIMPPIPRRKTS